MLLPSPVAEVGLPYLKARFLPVVQEKLNSSLKPVSPKPSEPEHPDEKEFLVRIRKEQLFPKPDISSEYMEMIVQCVFPSHPFLPLSKGLTLLFRRFGYLVLFSVVWPIAPLFSLVNNFVCLLLLFHSLSSKLIFPSFIDTV
jgi:anoctamin-10